MYNIQFSSQETTASFCTIMNMTFNQSEHEISKGCFMPLTFVIDLGCNNSIVIRPCLAISRRETQVITVMFMEISSLIQTVIRR